MLDGVVDYLPCPTEVKPQPEVDLEGNPTGTFAIVDADKPLRALAFKIMDDRFGALTFLRIYSGKLEKGTSVLNTFTGKTERIGRIVEMHADARNELDSAQAGDIVAVLGMKNVQTGHTLCDPKFRPHWSRWCSLILLFRLAISPKDKAASKKWASPLGKMIQEDPSFHVETDEDSGETILKGMGELHLDIKVDILRRTHGVDVIVGKPQVAYRETITKSVEDNTPTRNNQVVQANTAKSTILLSLASQAAALSLSQRSLAVTCLENFGQRLKKALKACWIKAFWPDSLAWTLKLS